MSAQESRPLLLLDLTVTVNTWGYFMPGNMLVIPNLIKFRPIPGRGFRIRVEVVDTTELEALEKQEV